MEVGGYFNLELNPKQNHLHKDAFACNTGRNAFEYILTTNNVKKIYVPYFTCDVIFEPIEKLAIPFEWYEIDKHLELKNELHNLGEGDYILYTNYFGIKDEYITKLAKTYPNNLIIDNAQALFSTPISNIPTFYSPRKFIGIPDGGYVYLDKEKDVDQFEFDYSYDRCQHLLKRLECDGAEGYSDFKENSDKLSKQPIKKMSVLTKRMISSVNLNTIIKRRIKNFIYLHEKLGGLNELSINVTEKSVPMVYPLLITKEGLKEMLISNQVFVATYWPNVFEWSKKGSLEYSLAKYIIPLPIDQRYSTNEMKVITSIIWEHK